jgi:hypothetical protein
MSKNLDVLKGLFGDQVSELTEEQTTSISEKLDSIIDSRVDAKVKFQTEVVEADTKEKYDTLLKEATDKFEGKIKTLEESLVEKAATFKKTLEEAHDKVKTQLEEAKEEETSKFKEFVVEKVDKYLKLELDKKIPDTYVEAVAKVQVLEPIVEGVKKSLSDNYIQFDEENFGLLKDAKDEIITVRADLAESVKKNMEINDKLVELQRSVKVSQVCEGLTDTQRERATKLLESYGVDEIEDRMNAIRDLIIEGEGKPSSKKIVNEEEEVEGQEGSDESEKTTDSGAPTGEVSSTGEEDAEEEDAVVKAESTCANESVDVKALKDDKTIMESWAKEFKRISG